jgi:NADH-quinone oxidoreductase subunit N
MIPSLINTLRGFLAADGLTVLPELELLLFALGILLIDFWIEANEKYWNAVLALAGVAFSAFTILGTPSWWSSLSVFLASKFSDVPILNHLRLPVFTGLINRSGDQVGFHETLLLDSFFYFFALVFLAATALVILLSVRYLEIEEEQEGEYYALLLFACVGMMLMASGIDLIVLFLGLETMALSFYILTGFLRREKRSNEAAMKYVLLGAFSSGILAYGFSLLYGMSGSTNIGQIGAMLDRRAQYTISHGLTDWFTVLAFVTIATGLFFKVAAVPFHQWAPDVYEGAPTPVTLYVSVASKTASFALLIRLFMAVFGGSHGAWLYLVAGVAIASLTWGNLAAITQTNVKRLLAYSAISHVGYILLGLVAGNATGFIGIFYYLFVYVFMTAGAFAVIIVLRQRGIIGEELDDLDGLYQRSPAAALLLLIFMLSLAGIPPTAGFMGKYFIFLALIETHHPVLAVFAVLYIVPALYYYFRIVVHAWLKQPGGAPRPSMSNAQAIALGVAVFVSLAAGLYPEPFTRLAHYAFGQ